MNTISDELFRSLVAAARLAPSADNTQPCAFDKQGAAIRVFILRERMLPTDIQNMFSWIAAGAAVENIALAATTEGLLTSLRVRGDTAGAPDADLVAAELTFSSGAAEHPLAKWLDRRMTNRKPYSSEALPEAVLRQLAEIAGTEVAVHWLRTEREKAGFADVMAECDRTRLEHRPFHEELFSILRLSDEEAEARGDGLNLPSLEIPASQAPMLRRMANFDLCQKENEQGFSRSLARAGADLVKQSAAVGLISIADPEPEQWFGAGRAFERIWLAAAAQQLSLQPIGGLPQFLTRLVLAPETFLDEHRARMQGVRERLAELFPAVRGRELGLLFRVGRCSSLPTGRSHRLPPERLWRTP